MPPTRPPRIILPARDEAARIGRVIEALRAVVPEAELWVIDGGSQDETAMIARAAGATVRAQGGRGYSNAVLEGLVAAHQDQVPATVLMDADGQHPPAAVPRLLAAVGAHDWVVASRDGTRSPGPLRRKLGNHALRWVVAGLTGQRFGDLTSGMQAFGPRALAVFAGRADDGVADANLRVLAARAGLRTAELPVQMDIREGGRSMHDGLAGLANLGKTLRACVAASTQPVPG